MDLKKKLDRLKDEKCEALLKQLGGSLKRASELPAPGEIEQSNRKSPTAGKTISSKDLEALPKSKPAQRVNLPGVEAMFPDGQMLTGETGSLFHRRVSLCAEAGEHECGYVCELNRSQSPVDPAALAELAGDAKAEIALSEWAFIDIETTGLGGGTGTFPFLTGIGYFTDDGFNVEQFFMPDFPDERAMLEAVRDRMNDFHALASYNGKSFDMPVLRSRFLLNRMASVWEKPHWDMLHTCRRIWKRRLGSCALGNIERGALGREARSSDMPGAEIPGVYFDYIRGARRERMRQVFDHHAQDIFSLGELALRIGAAWRNAGEGLEHADDLAGMAGMHEARGDWENSVACLENALAMERRPDMIHELSLNAALCYKRLNRRQDAVDIWRAQIDGAACAGVRAHVELAKHLEHHERQFEQAIQITQKALRLLDRQLEWRQYVEEEINLENLLMQRGELLRRLERLNRKRDRNSQDNHAD